MNTILEIWLPFFVYTCLKKLACLSLKINPKWTNFFTIFKTTLKLFSQSVDFSSMFEYFLANESPRFHRNIFTSK